MVISMTPLRVSFLGGGSDYPEHFKQYGGVTLGTTVDKYTYITVSPLTEFFDHSIRVSYSKTELCRNVDEIQHPAVRECLRYLGIDGGVEINIVSDLPARTGLGSSSSFTVGLLHALYANQGRQASPEKLASEAVYVEREMIRERVGLQDQYTCSHGGIVSLEYVGADEVHVMPVVISPQRRKALEERLLIFYTGIRRYAHEVLEEQMERTSRGEVRVELNALADLAREGMDVLCNHRDLKVFGELLHEAWMLKRGLSSTITSPLIDEAYESARKAGAVGGKLMGAGGGGFLLLYAEPYNHDDIRAALGDMKEVQFTFESQGTRLIFYRP